jgi:hypothetical protein
MKFLKGLLMFCKIPWLTKSHQRRRKLCVCVCVCARAEHTANYSFAKGYSVQSTFSSISNHRRRQTLRSPSRILRSLPMDDCHFCYISKLTKKEIPECWELDFLCYLHKPMLSYYWTVLCTLFNVHSFTRLS